MRTIKLPVSGEEIVLASAKRAVIRKYYADQAADGANVDVVQDEFIKGVYPDLEPDDMESRDFVRLLQETLNYNLGGGEDEVGNSSTPGGPRPTKPGRNTAGRADSKGKSGKKK